MTGLVAQDVLARGGVDVGWILLCEDGVAAGRLVFCSATPTGAFDLFGAGRARVPVAGRLAEMAAWEGFGAGGRAGGEGRCTGRAQWEECRR